jgi:hypothetical protein
MNFEFEFDICFRTLKSAVLIQKIQNLLTSIFMPSWLIRQSKLIQCLSTIVSMSFHNVFQYNSLVRKLLLL